jgi:predicted metal-dependent peptidase
MQSKTNFISNEEHFRIARELEKHHAVFERIWTFSRIRLIESKKMPTAMVLFNKKGDCVDFIVNREFWENQTFTQKCFVLSHECMHIALNHGRRSMGFIKNKKASQIANLAQDLVINHNLVNKYGFVRKEIDPPTEQAPLGMYCWLDKLLPERTDLTEDENYEVYFNALMDKVDQLENMMQNSKTVDDHDASQGQGQSGDGDGDGDGGGDGDIDGNKDKDNYDFLDTDDINMDDYSNDFSDVIDRLNDELTEDEKDSIKNFVQSNGESGEEPQKGKGGFSQSGPNTPGTSAGGIWVFAKQRPVKKRKWEAIVTDWAKKRMTETYKEVDQWVHKNRRFTNVDTGLMLPTEYEVLDEFEEEDQIEVWFFQDTSGSCSGYIDRFFAIAESMPEDKFDMRLFCFDTKIYETDLKSRKLYGFGGTYFHIIENFIQQKMAEDRKLKYPDAVFVITDGYGSDVRPSKPKNWHVILTPQHQKSNFPSECNFYDLAKYE